MKFSQVKDSFETGGQYFKLKPGDNRVRLVSEPIIVWKAFSKTDKTAKVYLTKDAAKQNPDSKQRYMMYVINRENGLIQQAEFGISIMSQLADLQSTADYAFDTLPPYDITIKKTGESLDTEYSVIPARANTELTSEEMAKIMALEPLEKVVGKDAEDFLPF